MTLVDFEIQQRVANSQLIQPFDPDKLSNCRYYLRAGKVFLPESGHEQVIRSIGNQGERRLTWSIKPSETLVIMTRESITMPRDLYATYGSLHHLAQKGLLLVNASIVEPGYQGPLSCFLVNFSRQTIHIAPDDPIAKICFHPLSAAPQNLYPLIIPVEKYESDLAKAAAQYPTSFMDIGGVEKRVADSVTKSINNTIKWTGVLITLLLLWATLEPLFNKWIYEKSGALTNTGVQEVMKLRQELNEARNDVQKALTDLKAEKQRTALEVKVKQQAQQIEALKLTMKRLSQESRPSPGR
ncbi:MAG: hypothetical protein M3347_05600 [Armatimonadota bacterium]|nr:hypothetical protein [Armatimonadota bacterium]